MECAITMPNHGTVVEMTAKTRTQRRSAQTEKRLPRASAKSEIHRTQASQTAASDCNALISRM
jgi:hypothetical protein